MNETVSDGPPSPAVREALQWGYRDALREYGERLTSLGTSISEAAYRGSDSVANLHIVEARSVLIQAIEVAKALRAVTAELPAANHAGAA